MPAWLNLPYLLLISWVLPVFLALIALAAPLLLVPALLISWLFFAGVDYLTPLVAVSSEVVNRERILARAAWGILLVGMGLAALGAI